jgi:hypothetical protein
MTDSSPTSSGHALVLLIGGIFLLVLGLLLIFTPELARDTLAGFGPVMFLAGVVALTGYCVVGAVGNLGAPAESSRHARMVPAGWYPDPHGQAELRYWDGNTWTEHTSGEAPGAAGPTQIDQPQAAPTSVWTVGATQAQTRMNPPRAASGGRPLLSLDEAHARSIQGPATMDGIGPTRGWEIYWMEVDVKRRRAAPWAAHVPDEIAEKVRLSAAE